MIRIVHTADNHLGMNYSNWKNKEAAQKASEERFEALDRIVQYANNNKVDYLVIAGDLFEKSNVPASVIDKCVTILGKALVPVVIIPGNHDYFENDESKLWKYFSKKAENANILLLNSYRPVLVESGEKSIWFYPCYCDNKHSPTGRLDWVHRNNEVADAHIGLAHGNLEGLGLGADKYFNMTRAELLAKNLDLWLLGHIHVPWPDSKTFDGEKILMPGTHTPDGYGRNGVGGFFDIKFHNPQKIEVEWVKSGELNFRKFNFSLAQTDHINELRREITRTPPDRTLINLHISGRLTENDLQELDNMLADTGKAILDFQIDNNVIKKLEQADINKDYPDGSLPFKVLTQLVDMAGKGNEQAALALEQGYDLFQKHMNK